MQESYSFEPEICVPKMSCLMTVDSEKVTDLDIQALVDNELSAGPMQAVAERVKESPLFQKRYSEISRQNDLLKMWWSSGKRTT